MSKTWKWKVIGILTCVFVAIYMLVPTLLGFKELREAAYEKEQPLPWYVNLFPEKGINLGLDLKGGIYLELDVDLDNAVENKIDLISTDLEKFMKKEGLEPLKMLQPKGSKRLHITVVKDQLEELSKFIMNEYQDVLTKQKVLPDGDNRTVVFALRETYQRMIEERVVKQAVETTRNRIDRYGVSEPSIQRQGKNRIIIELPGVKDPARAIDIIKKTGQLQFKLVDETIDEGNLKTMVNEARKDNNLPDDFSIATVTRINELVRKTIPEESEVAFQTHYDPVTNKISGGTPFLLKRKAEVTGDMLQNVQVQVHNNEPYVSLVFNKMGTKLFGDVTKNNVGKRLAIMLDGRVDKAPVIRDAILSGHAQITFGMGTYNNLMREAEDLVLILQEGALPASMTEATKTVVGPSLGQDSINKGIKSIAIGGFLVVLFMFIYYRLSGALANLALVLNIIFIMALLALFQATLTLPGIAGIVLTIGMAVDANVIIFERIREEIKLGKTARAAIDSGYSNAMRAILDANITTLIAGVVLYQFGTGPIRGFAVTLIMGIVASLFTAIVITRTVYDYFSVKRKIQRISI